MRVHQVPAHSVPFHSIASLPRRDPSSNQFSGSPLLLASSLPLSSPLFPSFLYAASAVPSPFVGSILCRARPDRTQITYRRFRFNIRSRWRDKDEENGKREARLVTDRNDKQLRTTIQLIQSVADARAPAVLSPARIRIFVLLLFPRTRIENSRLVTRY